MSFYASERPSTFARPGSLEGKLGPPQCPIMTNLPGRMRAKRWATVSVLATVRRFSAHPVAQEHRPPPFAPGASEYVLKPSSITGNPRPWT